jgi:hypothetical protein
MDAIAESWLGFVLSSKGRTCAEQFGHIHNVQLMWLKPADPSLLAGLNKVEKEGITKAHLSEALTASGVAIAPSGTDCAHD